MNKTRILTFMSMLVALYVLLSHVVPVVQVSTLKISFGFIPQSFESMLFGPVIGAAGSVAGDILGMLIAPKGDYFPGFTLSALLTGLIYGLFLYRKPKTLLRITLAVTCITVFINLGLNTYWLTILNGQGYLAILPPRILKNLIMIPVQVGLISLLWKYAGSLIERNYTKQTA